jgi:glycosyltransferase involved in cell wall biosynthesis
MTSSQQPALSDSPPSRVLGTPLNEGNPLSIVFMFDVRDTLMENGYSLRFFRYARLLRQRGHRVYFLVPGWSYDDGVLRQLVDRGDIDGFACLKAYYATGWENVVSRLFVHPVARNWIRRDQQTQALRSLLDAVETWHCDLIVLVNRMYLFAIKELRKRTAVVVEWGDSFTLALWRTAKLKVARRRLRGLGSAIRTLVASAVDESYYTRIADASIVVSPIDKRVIDRLSRRPDGVYLQPNGISFPHNLPRGQRDPNRIIFTGCMYSEPNCEAALWFLSEVFPLLLKQRPATRFVIAGKRPIPELVAQASESVEVTGAVPDLSLEIAKSQLYVAPLVSGGGFKNKVFEAIAADTYVVGTSLAAEFLTPDLLSCVTVADGAKPLADAIVKALADPESLRPRVERAQQILKRDYSWEGRTVELERIFRNAIAARKRGARV